MLSVNRDFSAPVVIETTGPRTIGFPFAHDDNSLPATRRCSNDDQHVVTTSRVAIPRGSVVEAVRQTSPIRAGRRFVAEAVLLPTSVHRR